MKIELIEDHEDARELWTVFQREHDGQDAWPGDDHTYWRAVDAAGETQAIMSAVYRPDKGYAYLSYAIVHPLECGAGLQRRLIRHRLRWAKRQGAIYAVTYTLLHNYPSIANLLKCGFRFAREPCGWYGVGENVHYFEKQL